MEQQREKLLLKTLLGAEEKAEVAGRIKEDVKIVKSITLVIAGIDAQEGRSPAEGNPMATRIRAGNTGYEEA